MLPQPSFENCDEKVQKLKMCVKEYLPGMQNNMKCKYFFFLIWNGKIFLDCLIIMQPIEQEKQKYI